MNLLRSFNRVPIPSIVAVAPMLAMWVVWWLATQFQPTVFGFLLTPVTLGVVAAFAVQGGLNLSMNPHSRRLWHKNRFGSLAAIALVATLLALALWVQDARVTQIGFTLWLVFLGATPLWFVIFSPEDLGRLPNYWARLGHHLRGSQTILGLFHLLCALTSAALIGIGAEAAWVAFISGGRLILTILNGWIIVLWMAGQQTE